MIERTQQQIVAAALRLFLTQGIKKTTMEEIAYAAGVTRVTAYRYFSQREGIVQAAFDLLVSPFLHAQMYIALGEESSIDAALNLIMDELAQLPQGDLPACLDELARVYPAVYERFTQQRRAALSAIFDHIYRLIEARGLLRPGLRRPVVEAFFYTTVINVLENPSLRALGLPPTALFNTVKEIFLYGLLKT